MVRLLSHSQNETESIGEKLAVRLKGREAVALFGDLGAGKTAFTRGLCRGLGIEDGVSSPTFAIVNAYEGRYPVYHFDMYRITSADDLFAVGFYDYLGTGVLVIEWSENIESELDDSAVRVRITKTENENDRIIEIEGAEQYDISC